MVKGIGVFGLADEIEQPKGLYSNETIRLASSAFAIRSSVLIDFFLVLQNKFFYQSFCFRWEFPIHCFRYIP